jgi:predicted nucleic acid-binding protein
MAYLLDTNVFIEARKRWYGFDFCPAYWDWLDQANAAKKVFSIERVADELVAGDDELVQWTRDRSAAFFLKPDSDVLASLSRLSRWATGGMYDQSAVATFLEAADSYLVAHAHAHGHTVVTHEKVANSTRSVKIPNACVEMGVKYVNTFEMLRIERARFVLGEPD